MSRSSIILRNVASNWGGFTVNAVVTLVLTPFVLRELGTSRYGIWILTSSIIGYYGLLDLGFRAGVTQYLTRYLAVGDNRKASECMSSAVTVLGGLGALMVALSVGAAYLAPRIFHLPAGMEREAFWCILIVGCSSAIQFALNPYTSIFTATQRFDLANAIGVGTRLLGAAGIAASLKLGYGLIGVSAATCSVSALDYILRWRVACRLAPGIKVSPRYASMRSVKEISSFGAWNFLISINGFVYQHVPNILIGSVLGVVAVGYYALATGLLRQVNSILSPVPQVLYPAATELHVRGDRSALERLYHDGTRLTMLVMIPLVMGAAFWAHDFYHLWIGEKYVNQSSFQSVAFLFQILLISTATSYTTSIAQQILVGAGAVRRVAVALVSASATSLAVSVVLIRYFGLAGVAAAVVVASLAVDLIAMPVMLQKELGLSVTTFIRRACLRPLAAGALQVLLMASIRLNGPALSWLHLAGQGILAAFGSVAIMMIVGVTHDERQRLVIRPLRRLLDRNRPAGVPLQVNGE